VSLDVTYVKLREQMLVSVAECMVGSSVMLKSTSLGLAACYLALLLLTDKACQLGGVQEGGWGAKGSQSGPSFSRRVSMLQVPVPCVDSSPVHNADAMARPPSGGQSQG